MFPFDPPENIRKPGLSKYANIMIIVKNYHDHCKEHFHVGWMMSYEVCYQLDCFP